MKKIFYIKIFLITFFILPILFFTKTVIAAVDTDKDGLSDEAENVLKTSPTNPDIDNDGKNDKEEITAETNPYGSDLFVPPTFKLNGSFKIQANGPVYLYVMSPEHKSSDGFVSNATGKYVWGINGNFYNDYCASEGYGYGVDFIQSNDPTITAECGHPSLFVSEISNPLIKGADFPTNKPWKIFVFPRQGSNSDSMYQLFIKDDTNNLIIFLEKGRKIKDIPDSPYTISFAPSCGLTVGNFPNFSPAKDAGLRAGDFIVGINNIRFSENNLPDIKNLEARIPIVLNTGRGDFTVTPAIDPSDGKIKIGTIDVSLAEGCGNNGVESKPNPTPTPTPTPISTPTPTPTPNPLIENNIESTLDKNNTLFFEEEKKLVKNIDKKLIQRLKGNILLQTESHGEAWYLDPKTEKKFYLKGGQAAYSALRKLGVGTKNIDLSKIPIGIISDLNDMDADSDGLPDKLEEAVQSDPNNPDTDGDGYSDGDEVKNGYNPKGSGKIVIDKKFIDKAKGEIFLQVESRGEAWYINPKDGKRYYMKDGDAAYQIMRKLSLGVSNNNLRKIMVGDDLEKQENGTGKLQSCQTPNTINNLNLIHSREVGLSAKQGYYGLDTLYTNPDTKETAIILLIETKQDSVPMMTPAFSYDSTYYPLYIGKDIPVNDCSLAGKSGYCISNPWNEESFKSAAESGSKAYISGANYFSYKIGNKIIFADFTKRSAPISFINGKPTSQIPYFPTIEESISEFIKQFDCIFENTPDYKK